MRSPRRGRSSRSASCVVTGHGGEAVAAAGRAIDEDIRIVVQAEQRGTGHAVLQAAPALAGFDGDVVVLYADTPLIRPETLQAMLGGAGRRAPPSSCSASRRPTRAATAGWSPTRTGLAAIVEARDATPEQRAIRLCNSGADRRGRGAAARPARRRSAPTTPRASTT